MQGGAKSLPCDDTSAEQCQVFSNLARPVVAFPNKSDNDRPQGPFSLSWLWENRLKEESSDRLSSY
jgi:hypothetical protein